MHEKSQPENVNARKKLCGLCADGKVFLKWIVNKWFVRYGMG